MKRTNSHIVNIQLKASFQFRENNRKKFLDEELGREIDFNSRCGSNKTNTEHEQL